MHTNIVYILFVYAFHLDEDTYFVFYVLFSGILDERETFKFGATQ